MAVLQENELQPWRQFNRWLVWQIYPIIDVLQVRKHVSFDLGKEVKVVFFSRKQNSYPHTPLSFSSKHVTRHIRSILSLLLPQAWHMYQERQKKVPNQIGQTVGLLQNLQNYLTSTASPASYKGYIGLHLDYWEVIHNEA